MFAPDLPGSETLKKKFQEPFSSPFRAACPKFSRKPTLQTSRSTGSTKTTNLELPITLMRPNSASSLLKDRTVCVSRWLKWGMVANIRLQSLNSSSTMEEWPGLIYIRATTTFWSRLPKAKYTCSGLIRVSWEEQSMCLSILQAVLWIRQDFTCWLKYPRLVRDIPEIWQEPLKTSEIPQLEKRICTGQLCWCMKWARGELPQKLGPFSTLLRWNSPLMAAFFLYLQPKVRLVCGLWEIIFSAAWVK